jgi:hypothetical protein
MNGVLEGEGAYLEDQLLDSVDFFIMSTLSSSRAIG